MPFARSWPSTSPRRSGDTVFENGPAESKVSLTLEISRGEIAWNLLPYATWYDIVVGDLSDLRSSDGDYSLATDSCLTEDRRELFTDEVDDLDDPDAGEGTWFLIRAVVNGISGTYGDAGVPRDAGILASGHDCLQ